MKAFPSLLLFAAIASCSFIGEAAAKSQPHQKVLILGAGLSGIIAGKTLVDNGVDDFLILEGQDYIGGRIKKGSIGGYKVELGANWIHFATAEGTLPIWNLKKKTNLTGIISDYTNFIIRNDAGANITDMTSYHKFQKIMGKVEEAQGKRKRDKKGPIPSRIGLALMGWKPKTPAQTLIEYLDIDFEMGKSPELVPFRAIFAKETDFFVTDKRGMLTLYKGIYQKFEDKIKVNKTVTNVKYNSTVVEVTTSDGDIYTADMVLCTFSTGVLASDFVKFDPPFPEWKMESILKFPMSAYTSVFLKFPRKFWDDKEYILMASSKRRGYYPVFQDLDRPGISPNGSGLLLITATGDEGRRIEKQSFEKTKAEIVEMLRGVYGQNVSEPTDIYCERWTLNPYFGGAYSDGTVGVSSKDHEHLSQNLGRLHFSGEATSKGWYGYMQGAYITGAEKAKVIAGILKCQEEGRKDCDGKTNGAATPNVISTFFLLFLLISFYFCNAI